MSQAPFRKRFELSKRKLEASRIMTKYDNRVPVIIEVTEDANAIVLDKFKYLCPSDLSCGQFQYVIRKRTKLEPEEAMFLLVGGMMPSTSDLMSQLYKRHKDEDGFLYMTVSKESTFGRLINSVRDGDFCFK